VASVAMLVSLCLSVPAAGAVGTLNAKEQLARVASQELSFAMPGVYVHGVALHGDTMAWTGFKPRGSSRYGNDLGTNHLFVSGIRSFHPEMLKTAPKRTIVQVALSGSWVVWEAQPPICYLGAPRCGMPPKKRQALSRHGCGGAIAFQGWFIYAQNLRTHQRVLVDSSFREEWNNSSPGSVAVLHVHGNTVMWGATHSAHCPPNACSHTGYWPSSYQTLTAGPSVSPRTEGTRLRARGRGSAVRMARSSGVACAVGSPATRVMQCQ
jgi:hypothetical protein